MLQRQVAIVFAVFLVCAGCSAQTAEDPSGGAPSATATPPPSPQQVAEQAALAAYRGMWAAFSTAAEKADWQSPVLRQHASGYALDQLVESLQADEVQGVVATGSYTLNPAVVSALPTDAPTVVRITDCGDASGTTRLRASDRQELPGGDRGRHRIESEVRLESDAWKVNDFRLRGAGSC